MAELLPGAPVAERLTQDLKARSDALRQRGVVPTLAIIRVGRDPGGLAYEKGAASIWMTPPPCRRSSGP